MNNPHHKKPDDIAIEQAEIGDAKKNPEKFGLLYERYYRGVFVFVFRRTGDEQLTADLVSNVFVKAMVGLKKYEPRGFPFSSWLFRIAQNEITSHYRKADSQRVVSLEKTNLVSILAELKDEEKTENEKLLLSSIAELDEEGVELIELRYFEQRAFSEVGQILGITENNAKVKLYRVLAQLKLIFLKKKNAS